MYSPKISEDLVIQLYKIAKEKRVPMTTLVNKILYSALNQAEEDNRQKESLVAEKIDSVSYLKSSKNKRLNVNS